MIKKYETTETGRQAELSAALHRASELYYRGEPSGYSDDAFDAMYAELRDLEVRNGFAYDISPSVLVGAEVVDGLQKSAHEVPALSLDKVKYKNRNELKEWLGKHAGVLSWKMDGLTVVLTYEGGRLKKAVTRGNGEIGEDVTHNAVYFVGVPVSVPFTDKVIVRGEATMKQTEFDRINDMEGGVYENARNLASSTVRLLDSRESRSREICFSAFSVTGLKEKMFTRQMEYLRGCGIGTVAYWKVTADTVLPEIERLATLLTENDTPTDGLVLTYDDQAYAESLGNTGHHPRGSIAMKWEDETAETTIRDIEWSAGRTGVVTPVAIFDTVRLGLGSNVARASMHNLSIAENMPSTGDMTKHVKCGVGSRVHVALANMIIPQIVSATEGKLDIPDVCPVCGQPLVIRNNVGVKTLWCLNEDCSVKKTKRFAIFASRDGMNIEGLSEKKLDVLLSKGYLKGLEDIFLLSSSDRLEALKHEDGWGETSVKNLLAAVEKARDVDLRHFLFALGIPVVGHDLSTKLSAYFHGDVDALTAFLKKTPGEKREELAKLDGLGPVKIESFCSYLDKVGSDSAVSKEFFGLLSQLRFKKAENGKKAEGLAGKAFVVTGDVHHFKNRNELKEFITSRGGKVAGSVSGKTTYLINNDSTSLSSKNKKAKELSIPVITEDEFLEMFG